MKESIGYTVTLNIIIIFIVIVFAFLGASLIYFRSNKISNVITTAIEKYEGYNSLAIAEIDRKISSLGYSSRVIKCDDTISDKEAESETCNVDTASKDNNKGYCVYLCIDKDGEYYYYKIRTNMMVNIPIINDILDIPVYSNTNRLYDFENNLK